MKPANITRKQLEENNYKFKTLKEACKTLNVSVVTYRKYLKKENITFKTVDNLYNDKVTKEWLVENWINTTKSLVEIADEYNLSLAMLESRASRFGLTKFNRYKFNENLFFDVSNPNVNYLAGLIVTDGYLDINSNRVLITLVGESEKYLLDSIKEYFEFTNDIKMYKENVYTFTAYHKNIKQFFNENFNIPLRNKTALAKVPNTFYNEDCAKAYVLGCLDGDGCISHLKSCRPTIVVTTLSDEFITGLANIIEFYTGVKVYCSKGKYSTMRIGAKKDVKKVLDWVYSTSSVFRLKRKYELYLKVKDIV